MFRMPLQSQMPFTAKRVAFVVKRNLVLPPFLLRAEQYAEFAQFCARVDEVERVPLRFTR